VLAEAPLKAAVRGRVVGEFRADLLVSGLVAVELKAVRSLEPIHTAQLLYDLRQGAFEVGLLLNFGPKPEVRRRLFENSRKRIVSAPRAE
jgi:GxxExxY protein